MTRLDPLLHKTWLSYARGGNRPPPVDVMGHQYGLDAPWHLRKHFLPALNVLGQGAGKTRICREVSRGGGKTQVASFIVLYSAEYVIPFMERLRPQNKRVLLLGRDIPHITQQNMKQIHQDICEYAPWLKTPDQETWKDAGALQAMQIKTRTWNNHQMDLMNGVSIRAFGWDQNIRGEHVPLVIIDDLLSEENAFQAEQQLAKIQGAIEPAIEPGGQLWVKGTPQGIADLYDRLRDDERWDFISLPAYDYDGSLGYANNNLIDIGSGRLPRPTDERDLHSLWPKRLSFAYLEDQRGKNRASELKFRLEYLLERIIDSTLLVHPNDIATAKNTQTTYLQSIGGMTYAGLDPSSLRQDEAAIVVLAINERGKRQIVHLETIPISARKINPLILFDRIKSVDARYTPNWLVEGNGFQQTILPLMGKEIPGLAPRMDYEMLTSNKHQMEKGWPIIRTVFETGSIVLPFGPTDTEQDMLDKGQMQISDIRSVYMTNMLIDQLSGVRYIAGKIVEDPKKKNDLVSALYLALKAAGGVKSGTDVIGKEIEIPFNSMPGRRERGEAEFGYKNVGPLSRVAAAKRAFRRVR